MAWAVSLDACDIRRMIIGTCTTQCHWKGTNLSPILPLPVNENISGSRGLVNRQMEWDRTSHPLRLLPKAGQD
jgi:hypothetical protein